MKKSLLLLASLFVSAASFADWTKPVVTEFTTLNADGETQYYLYNVGTNSFFLGANDYNTRASVSATKGFPCKFTDEGDGLSITDYVEKFSEWRKTFCDNPQSIWVDNNSGANCNTWQLSALPNGNYEITNSAITDENEQPLKFGIAELYQGKTGNTRCFFYDTTIQYDANGDEEITDDDPCIFGGEFYSEWALVTPEVYDAFIIEAQTYDAAQRLDAAIKAAKNEKPGIDLAAAEAVYNNTVSTKDELEAAITAVAGAVKSYDVDQLKNATVESPIDITAGFVVNASFEKGDLTGWTCDKKNPNGFGDSADLGAKDNSNGTYHCDNADGNYVFNVWAWGNPITQTIEGLPAGVYKLTAMVASSDDCTNVFITADGGYGEQHHAITLEEPKQTGGTRGSMIFASNGGDIIIGAVGPDADGKSYLKGGRWWYKADDFKLECLGTSDEAYQAWRDDIKDDVNPYDEDVIAQTSLLQEYNAAAETFQTASSASEIASAYEKLGTLAPEIAENITAYNNLMKKIDEWDKEVSENETLVGAEWGDFADFVQGNDVDGYPTPNPQDIKDGSYTLTTEEVNDYIEKVDELRSTAIAHSLSVGSDCTNMIKDANFTDANGTGWTKGGNCTNLAWTGGFSTFPVAESYHSTFDIYQVIEDVPDGVYSLSLNGFCRLDGGEASVPAEIYMNDFSTPLMNINEGALPTEEANDGFNCYLTKDDAGKYHDNPLFAEATHKSPNNATDGETDNGYIPNGMEGASVAFSADRYKATVYGLVEGGKMRIGIRNLTSSTVWALWGNFKLTFLGKDADALDEVLPVYAGQLLEYIEENSENMTEKFMEDANKLLEEAENAETGDAKYEAIKDINTAIEDAKTNVELVTKYNNINEQYESLVEGASNDDAVAAYEKLADEIAEYTNLDNTGLAELIVKMEKVATALKLPSLEEASESNPIEITAVLSSPSFEDEGGAATMAGWTVKNFQTQTNDEFAKTGSVYCERWHQNLELSISQTVKGLPAGKYTLTADCFSSVEDATLCGGDQETVVTKDAEAGSYSVEFTVGEDSDVTIGYKATLTSSTWVCVDNFQLYYLGGSSAAVTIGDITNLIDKYLESTDGVTIGDITKLIDKYLAQ